MISHYVCYVANVRMLIKANIIIPECIIKASRFIHNFISEIHTMHTILIIEDDFNISTLYKIKLEHSGYTCLQAYNGLEALKLLENNVPDFILLDLKMPVMDGEQFLELYRKNYSTLTAPIIVLTNINSSEAPKTLWHHAIDDYIIKAHTTPSELVEAVEKILKLK